MGEVASGVAEVVSGQVELDETEHHADAGGGEAEVPVQFFTEQRADQWADGGPQVDSHVEEGEAGVPAAVAALICWRFDGRTR